MSVNINESTTLSAPITVKGSNGSDTQVAYLSATVNGANHNMSINVTISNEGLLSQNAETAQIQYTEFENAIKEKAKALGFGLFA